jgi:hypothetical protein
MRRPVSRMRGRFSLALWAVLLVLPGASDAATPEAEVKAAYLFKLASFVRWPPDAGGGSFSFCVAGRGDVAGVLEQLARGQQMGGKAITVVQITGGQADVAKGCQILFLGRGVETARALTAATRDLPVLTVGDRNNGTRGGVVDFLIQSGRVRLAIDRGEAARRHLDLNSKLLAVAVAVDG